MTASSTISPLHICCIALGTRGDVQPVACIASHLQRTHDHVSVSFITHTAHSIWLESGVYSNLRDRVTYIASKPAGGCWTPQAPPTTPGLRSYGDPSAASKFPYVTGQEQEQGQPQGQTSVAQPDPWVIDAICNCVSAFADDMPGTPVPFPTSSSSQSPPPLRLPVPTLRTSPQSLCTMLRQRVRKLRQRLFSQSAHAQEGARRPFEGPRKQKFRGLQGPKPLYQETEEEEEEEEEEGRKPRPKQWLLEHAPSGARLQQQQRHVIVFNLFALEAYHAAEALGLPCAVAAPYMIPYRCPAAFVRMFRQELPDLYDALSWSEKLLLQQQQGLKVDEGRCYGTVAVIAAADTELAPKPIEASGRARHSRITFSEVTHWMWPLFTERWGEWRRSVLGLPALPLHRYHVETHGLESECPGGAGDNRAAHYGDGEPGDLDLCGSEEALPLDCLPPAPPLLYGFSELVVPRPPYWPDSVTACGFWQPPLEWFAGQQLPTELLEVLRAAPPPPPATAGTTAPAVPSTLGAPPLSTTEAGWCLIDFGSCGRMGFIPAPLDTLTLLDTVLHQLDMRAILLTGGWQPFHLAVAELHKTSSRRGRQLQSQQLREQELPQQQPGPPRQREQPHSVGRGKRRLEVEVELELDAGVEGPAEPLESESTVAASHLVRNTAIDDIEAAVEDPTGNGDLKPAQLPMQPQPQPQPQLPRIHLYGGDVAHQLVLPYCRLVLHHGGSGTTAAALLCGIPQVTCPFHFDQHFWAERTAHLGVASAPLHRRLLFESISTGPNLRHTSRGACAEPYASHNEVLMSNDPRVISLTAAFRDALEPSKLKVARTMAKDLAAEAGGLQTAAQVLLALAAGRQGE
ncbi:hypothetical protein VaNZ11_009252 [Volvox africanus]|uniref:Erythromycin biosynthesis protein CIII-like C-terminal domain-containing protein n=1 Tax=Volvox africanus TaxID=51714 RepID=A0ABQ5S6X1_9CHLO|nr:hypothetical protein VaNZ11_009252 [Volvox africanus]